jgi:hypothetical protein
MFNSQPIFADLEENFGDLLDAFDARSPSFVDKAMVWLTVATAGLIASVGAGVALAEWVV